LGALGDTIRLKLSQFIAQHSATNAGQLVPQFAEALRAALRAGSPHMVTERTLRGMYGDRR